MGKSPQSQVVSLTVNKRPGLWRAQLSALADSVPYGCVLDGVKIVELLEVRGTSHMRVISFIYSKTFIKLTTMWKWVESHYLWILYLQIHLLTESYLLTLGSVPIVLSCFSWTCVYTEQRTQESSLTHVPSLRSHHAMLYLTASALTLQAKVLFLILVLFIGDLAIYNGFQEQCWRGV